MREERWEAFISLELSSGVPTNGGPIGPCLTTVDTSTGARCHRGGRGQKHIGP
jgi:hypothetical protein